jgi:hypothetical protein
MRPAACGRPWHGCEPTAVIAELVSQCPVRLLRRAPAARTPGGICVRREVLRRELQAAGATCAASAAWLQRAACVLRAELKDAQDVRDAAGVDGKGTSLTVRAPFCVALAVEDKADALLRLLAHEHGATQLGVQYVAIALAGAGAVAVAARVLDTCLLARLRTPELALLLAAVRPPGDVVTAGVSALLAAAARAMDLCGSGAEGGAETDAVSSRTRAVLEEARAGLLAGARAAARAAAQSVARSAVIAWEPCVLRSGGGRADARPVLACAPATIEYGACVQWIREALAVLPDRACGLKRGPLIAQRQRPV